MFENVVKSAGKQQICRTLSARSFSVQSSLARSLDGLASRQQPESE